MVSPRLGLSRRAAGDDVCSCGQQEEEQGKLSGGGGEEGGVGGVDKEVRNSWHCILHEGVGTNDKSNDSRSL